MLARDVFTKQMKLRYPSTIGKVELIVRLIESADTMPAREWYITLYRRYALNSDADGIIA